LRGLTGGDGERWRGCREAADLLLGHPGRDAGRGSVGSARNMRCPGSLACSGELDVESDKGAEVVWEVSGSGVSSMEGFGTPFKGEEGRRERCTGAT
jgi:hypothetical protein